VKSNNLREAVKLLLIILLILAIFVGVGAAMYYASQKGQEVSLGSCLSFDDGYKFCHSMWVKNITYVTVFKDGIQTDFLVIMLFQTVESQGYSVTASGLSVYIEPTP